MSILSSAELLLQAKNFSGTGDWQDETGNGHHAQLGSTSGGDTNDPLFKAYTGEQYIFLPGTSTNYLSTPDAAALDIIGNIWLSGRFALDDWTPAADTTLIAKWEDTGNERSYRLMVDTTGVLRMSWTTNGAAATLVEEDSTVAPTVTDGDALWVAGTLEVSTGDVKFYTGGIAPAPSWAQLGTTVSGAGATSINSGSAVVEVGSDNTGTAQHLLGEIYNAQVENGYDEGVGTLVFDVSSATPEKPFATFIELSSQGATVTINRSASGLVSTVVDRDMFLLTTDDYFDIPFAAGLDFAEVDDFTIMVYSRIWTAAASGDRFVHHINANGIQMSLTNIGGNVGGRLRLEGATTQTNTNGAELVDFQAFVIAGRRDASGSPHLFTDGVAGSAGTDSTGTLEDPSDFFIGGSSTSGYIEGEIFAIVLWRKALTDDEVADAATLLSSTSVGSRFVLLGVP